MYLSPQIKILLKISFTATFAESLLVPMYSAFTEKVGGSILDAGIAFAVFSMVTGLVVTLVGTRDWFQKDVKIFLTLGFLVSACCDVAYIFVQDKWQLFGAQSLAGLATGFIEPAWDSIFTDDIEQSSAKHWSVWAGGTHLVSGAAALLGGIIVAASSFTYLFMTMALLDLVAIYLTWKVVLAKKTLAAESAAE